MDIENLLLCQFKAASELAAELHSRTENIFPPLPPALHGVEANDPGARERMLIAGSDGVFRPQRVVAPALDRGRFDDNLTIKVGEQVLQSQRPAVRVARGGVERRIARQAVGLERDSSVPQYAAGIAPARQRLRVFEAGKKVEVRDEIQRIDDRPYE